jgi:hexosaminidase
MILITFVYTEGAHKLAIRGVELLANNIKIGSDPHHVISELSTATNVYRLVLDTYSLDSELQLHLTVMPLEGINSKGVVYLSRYEVLEPAT